MEEYCMKYRSKREVSNPQAIAMRNDRPATQGACPVCNTKLSRIQRVPSQTLPSLHHTILSCVRAL